MQTTAYLAALLRAAAHKPVVVFGDLYLDTYITGTIRGVSPEDPVLLLEATERRHTPGAAGNIAAGLVALGATAEVVGIIGDDAEADQLRACYSAAGIGMDGVLTVSGVRTNVHTRVVAGNTHAPHRTILRMDSQRHGPLAPDTEARLIASIQRACARADALIVLESASGLCSTAMIEAAQGAARAHDILLIGDAFGQAQGLRGYDLVLPNERETAALVGIEVTTEEGLRQAGQCLVAGGANKAAAITRGPRGIALFTSEGYEDVSTHEREVFDVTGAGDTVTAAFTVALLGGADLRTAAQMANLAAFVAVGRPGTAVVSADDLQHAMTEITVIGKGGKLRSLEELLGIVAAARAQGKRIAFTNGCFDLIHPGHVVYLRQAAELADMLVVALNSDVSVRSLKGPTRPILNQDERVMILSALESVAWITVFDDQRVTRLLRALKPEVWVKGGDYTMETLDAEERAAVQEYGGKIVLIPPVEGISTTDIVRRIEQARKRAAGAP